MLPSVLFNAQLHFPRSCNLVRLLFCLIHTPKMMQTKPNCLLVFDRFDENCKLCNNSDFWLLMLQMLADTSVQLVSLSRIDSVLSVAHFDCGVNYPRRPIEFSSVRIQYSGVYQLDSFWRCVNIIMVKVKGVCKYMYMYSV